MFGGDRAANLFELMVLYCFFCGGGGGEGGGGGSWGRSVCLRFVYLDVTCVSGHGLSVFDSPFGFF